MFYLLRGALIGLVFGVPAGAVGVLTVQRAWTFGTKAGLLTGLGSSAADCCYACVGAFGLTLVSGFLARWQGTIAALGGALILAMGLKSLLRPRAEAPAQDTAPAAAGAAGLFLTSFVIGITNPASVLTFLAAFSWLGITGLASPVDGTLLVAGVFCGTYFWWGSLTALTRLARRRAGRFSLKTINRALGAVLCIFGAAVLMRLLA